MVDSEKFSEEPVEDSCREDGLPESDKVETKRDATESPVALDSFYYTSCDVFRLEDRDDSGFHAVEHSGVQLPRGG